MKPSPASLFSLPVDSRRKNGGFTLVELLTVIAIIAILMGLLLPAAKSVKDAAKKTQAKNDASNIVTAVKAYYTEYGRYPVIAAASGDAQYTNNTDNAALMNILRGIDTNLNARQIVFVEVADVKNTNAPASGILDGAWVDPWGNAYNVQFDADYDNKLTTTPTGELRLGAIAWSTGKDKTKTNEWVFSWQ